MSSMNGESVPEMVTLTIDDVEVTVPKGTNLIEAAKTIGTEIPYYCYHRHLSVAGNCRMCQVEIEGAPKLSIGCNTGAQEGMVVRTQKSSQKVKEAQRATLEFLLINHPLDCTVCDQAGHCKLQDYYYEYNSKASRFLENKEHKVKAEVLGPEIIYDGERCIMCTRCVRFCDEVSKTKELSVLNRGDKTVIAIDPSKPLDNALAGCVVDLCPVGALTHRRWRFNSRIWYTKQEDTICAGCSTGCNAKVAVRDGKVIQVKGRLNSEVNQEWMCDEGRYGFERFQPSSRLTTQFVRREGELVETSIEEAIKEASALKQTASASETAVFLSPLLTLEEVWASVTFIDKVMGLSADSSAVAMQLVRRELTDTEKVLVSPDYAPNARSMNLFGVGTDSDWRASLEHRYQTLLTQLRSGGVKRFILIGDQALRDEDVDERLVDAIIQSDVSVAITPRGILTGAVGEPEQPLGAHQLCKVIFPSATINEKSGVLVNQQMRFQRTKRLLDPPKEAFAEWMVLAGIAAAAGTKLFPDTVTDERGLFFEMVRQHSPLNGLTLAKIGEWGLSYESLQSRATENTGVASQSVSPT